MKVYRQYFTPSECLELFDVPDADRILDSIEKETGFDKLPSFESLPVITVVLKTSHRSLRAKAHDRVTWFDLNYIW